MGPPALLPKEGVLRIFITLKNSLPWMGLNPQPLGTAASTLTATPPWRHDFTIHILRFMCLLDDYRM
jgi:hypothetical protein